MCTGDEVERRQCTEYGGGIQDAARRMETVVRVERWQGRIIAVWMMSRQQMVCVICVYGPQTDRTEAEKDVFREEVERLAGLSDGQTMLCVAGDFNAHIGVVEPGDEESTGKFGREQGTGKVENWWRC